MEQRELKLYVVEDRASRAFKIGMTNRDVRERLEELQVGNPNKLYLLATAQGDWYDERYIHQELRPWKCKGGTEWFSSRRSTERILEQYFPGVLLTTADADPGYHLLLRRRDNGDPYYVIGIINEAINKDGKHGYKHMRSLKTGSLAIAKTRARNYYAEWIKANARSLDVSGDS